MVLLPRLKASGYLPLAPYRCQALRRCPFANGAERVERTVVHGTAVAASTTYRGTSALVEVAKFGFLTCAFAVFATTAIAAEKPQRLSNAHIQARLTGMEITDEIHWADVYERGGALRSYSMGRKTIGKWFIRNNELCIERGKEEASCYQVWNSGTRIELRRERSDLPLQGILQKPLKRD